MEGVTDFGGSKVGKVYRLTIEYCITMKILLLVAFILAVLGSVNAGASPPQVTVSFRKIESMIVNAYLIAR